MLCSSLFSVSGNQRSCGVRHRAGDSSYRSGRVGADVQLQRRHGRGGYRGGFEGAPPAALDRRCGSSQQGEGAAPTNGLRTGGWVGGSQNISENSLFVSYPNSGVLSTEARSALATRVAININLSGEKRCFQLTVGMNITVCIKNTRL